MTCFELPYRILLLHYKFSFSDVGSNSQNLTISTTETDMSKIIPITLWSAFQILDHGHGIMQKQQQILKHYVIIKFKPSNIVSSCVYYIIQKHKY